MTGKLNFLDFEMLDAMIASALEKLINTTSKTSEKEFEEQRAQNSDRVLRGGQIAYMIY